MQQAEAYFTTRSEEETAYLGEKLGKAIHTPLTIALQGDLGAGKTVFVRGAARGLDVTGTVSSPTFVLLKIYRGRLPLYHFDFYRLSPDDDTGELGFEEYLPGDGAAFVEWADRLPELLPPEHLQVSIQRFEDEKGEGRRIWFYPFDLAAEKALETIFETVTWNTEGSLHMKDFAENLREKKEHQD